MAVLNPVNLFIATISILTPSRQAFGRPASQVLNTAFERPGDHVEQPRWPSSFPARG